MRKQTIILAIVAIALFAAWYAFRPERLFVNHRVDEKSLSAKIDSTARPLESGTFYSVLHPTQGTATIYRLANGTRFLSLTKFMTSNGPDVHIYMVAAPDAKDNASVEHANYIDLGVMKGNIGDQSYRLGSNVDLSKYRTVVVWCKRFSFNFGAAPLVSGQSASQG